MSDRHENNDELERLFKKKAAEYDLPYNESDWQKLESKLDLRDARRSYFRKVAIIAAASLLIIALLGYFTYDNYNRISELTRDLAEQQASADPDQQTEIDTFPSQVPPANENGDAAPLPLSDLPAPDITSSEVQDKPLPSPDIQPFDRPAAFTEQMAVASLPHHSRISSADPMIKSFDEFRRAEPAIYNHGITEHQFPESRQLSSVHDKRRGFTAGLVISPELSTAGSVSNFHDPGYRFGANLEYKLSSRFSISSGLISSRVRYSASAQNYNAPIYRSDDGAPEQMTADCLILDIPMNINFSFLRSGRSGFFLTAGFSSYIMLNENYYFEFTENVNEQPQNQSIQSGRMHFLSNAGFSAGYELEINSILSLRAEPFIKVPLQEVGWGNVKLYSLGSYFSVNYRF